jgi:lipopolysaccharide export system permease protein
MRIIDRYVGRQVLTSATFAVAVLSVVLVLGNIFKKLLDVLVKDDAPLEFILSFLAYILPFSLTFTIPWGFLTAVLLAFGKMSAENELIALKSNGVSIARICAPVAVLAVLFVGICLWINLDVAPRAHERMTQMIFRVATSNPLSLFRSDKVIEEFPGRKIFVERHEGKELYNLLVYELEEEDLKPMRIFFAKKGEVITDLANQQVLMRLYDARFSQMDDNEPDNFMKIKEGLMKETTLPISLKELYEKNQKTKGMTSMTFKELNEVKSTSAIRTERSKRFSFSLASLAFALIGVPLAITAHRKETSIGFGLSVVIAFTYFFIIVMVDWVRDKPKWHPELLIWSPNILFIALGIWMFHRLNQK